ncbi:MAG TPA: guanylate kinase [Abditibacteriaceae bacterium]
MSSTHASTKSPVPPTVRLGVDGGNPVGTGLLLVLSGPSGVGKDTVWKRAAPCLPSFRKAVTCTTRAQREGETHGMNYYFVSDSEFDRLIAEDQLLEWAHVHGFRYGIPAGPVLEALNSGNDIICVIDVQGAQRVKSLFPTAILVFLTPPEVQILEQRIIDRDSEIDRKELQDRLARVQWEMEHIPLYDHTIVNDTVEHAAKELCEVVAREKKKRGEVVR